MSIATSASLRQTETVEEPIEEDAEATEEPEKEADEDEVEVEEEEEDKDKDKDKPKTKKVGGSKVGVARTHDRHRMHYFAAFLKEYSYYSGLIIPPSPLCLCFEASGS